MKTKIKSFILISLFIISILSILNINTVQAPQAAITTISFGVAGDFGNGSNFQTTVQKMKDNNVNFSIALGDLSYTGGAETSWCNTWQTIGVPLELITGNHDSGESAGDGNINIYRTQPGCTHSVGTAVTGDYGKEYYFDYPASGNKLIRFIGISPHINMAVDGAGYYEYFVGNSHYNWLVNSIDNARTANIPLIAVYMHKNCESIGQKTGCSIGTDLAKLLIDKKVDLVLQGHDHNYQRFKQWKTPRPSQCPTVEPTQADAACIFNYGVGMEHRYNREMGPAVIISGTGGDSHYGVNFGDADANYIQTANGDTFGFTKISVTYDSQNAGKPVKLRIEFKPNSGTFTDEFRINKFNNYFEWDWADKNNGGAVEITDMSDLAQYFDTVCSTYPEPQKTYCNYFDYNMNGSIDIVDLATMAFYFDYTEQTPYFGEGQPSYKFDLLWKDNNLCQYLTSLAKAKCDAIPLAMAGWGGIQLRESKINLSNPNSVVFPGEKASDMELQAQLLNNKGLNIFRTSFESQCPTGRELEMGAYSASDLTRAISIAKYYKFWIVVDYHGYNDLVSHSSCWLDFWAGVVSQFKDSYNRLVWEPLNEPIDITVSQLSTHYQNWINQARSKFDAHYIVVQNLCSFGCGFSNLADGYPIVTDAGFNKIFISLHSYMPYAEHSSNWNNAEAEAKALTYYNAVLEGRTESGWSVLNTEGGADELCDNCAPDEQLTGSAGYTLVTKHFIQKLTDYYDNASPRISYTWWPTGGWTDTPGAGVYGANQCGSTPQGWGCLLSIKPL